MKVWLVNDGGFIKEVKIGFSWTMLLFGIFVPLHRADWLHLFLSFGLTYLTQGISWLIYPCIYNRLYVKKMLAKGWKPLKKEDHQILVEKGYLQADVTVEA